MLSMKFSVMNWQAAAMRSTGAVLLGALLTACGGGDQVEQFKPERIVSFGDETSVLEPAAPAASAPATHALKHTVNAVTSTGTLDCAQNPLWIQNLASAYSLVFSECNTAGVTTSTVSRARAGARVAASGVGQSVTAQVDAYMASPGFGGKVLVTVRAGQHDVIAQYERVKAGTASEADATAEVDAAGAALAGQVNRMAEAGGKVLISTIPNVAQTPFGVAEEAASPGRGDLLSRLTAAFNSRLRVSLTNDGRKIGLILADETISAVVRAGGFASVTLPACNAANRPPTGALTTCTTNTLVVAGATTSYLWADTLWLTPGGHQLLSQLAISRAQGNPF